MKKRMLGRRGLPVTSVCIELAQWMLYSGQLDFGPGLETALATIQRVLEGPFNFIDASCEYWQGAEGERRISRTIHEKAALPDGFVLTSRVGPALGLDFSGDTLFGPWKRAFSGFVSTVSRWSCYKFPKGSALRRQQPLAAPSGPFSGCGIRA